MIKETPASMRRVVLAFAGTAVVAVLPLLVLAMMDSSVRGVVTAEVSRYGGAVLVVGTIVAAVMATAVSVKAALRRKPRAASA